MFFNEMDSKYARTEPTKFLPNELLSASTQMLPAITPML